MDGFDDRPNFLKAAFLNVYNLSLLGGAGLAALATQDWLVGVGALALEAARLAGRLDSLRPADSPWPARDVRRGNLEAIAGLG